MRGLILRGWQWRRQLWRAGRAVRLFFQGGMARVEISRGTGGRVGSIYLDRDAADLLELRLRAAVLAGAERVAVVDFLDAAGACRRTVCLPEQLLAELLDPQPSAGDSGGL